jgi:long-subunit acyl-CoA synthetase (AMP-forming)
LGLIDFSGRVFSARSLFTGRKFEFVNLLIEVCHFFWVPRCFGGFVSEGYGMTESSCVIAGSQEGDNTSGHVGPPNPACEVKLVDVPEMEYSSDDKPYPRGEICVRGPLVFKGYFKDEIQTREILDEDGWLHSGDIGCWLPGGRLKIIDRFVLFSPMFPPPCQKSSHEF